jgi:diguanylate cyclase (GGDEF)-like protein
MLEYSKAFARALTRARLGWAAAFATIVLALVGLYYLEAIEPTARTWAYPAIGLLSASAVLVGIAVHRPAHPGPWILIATANLLFALGDVIWTVLATADETPFPSLADVLYLAGYPILAVALLWMIAIRVGKGDRSGMLDGATVAVAAALVGWVVLLNPILDSPGDPLELAISVAYPLGDLIVIGVAIGMLATPGARSASFTLLVASLVVMFAGDVIYALQVAQGTAVDGGPLDLAWMFAYAATGAAALLPSMRSVAVSSPVRIAWLSPVRIGFTAAAMIAGPMLLLLDASAGGTSAILLALGSGVLSLMVLARLVAVVRALARDNAARRALEDELQFRASHDPLTGLANRRRFMECLEGAVAGSDGQPVSVLFMDLDDFKSVNDELGHATGDAVLVAVARRIRAQLRTADVAARMGGDEFGILLHADERTAMAIARRLLEGLAEPVTVGGSEVSARGSIGVASARGSQTPSELLARADIAMYAAKAQGCGRVVAFQPGMRHGAGEHGRARPAEGATRTASVGAPPQQALSPGLT